MKKIVWMILCGSLIINAFAQESVISTRSVEQRERYISSLPRNMVKLQAEEFARRNGLPVRKVYPSGRVIEIMRAEDGKIPMYYTTYNLNAARTVSTDRVWEGEVGGFKLHGKNIMVAVWDAGRIRTTHVEFGTRSHSIDSEMEIDGHTTHVAGTIGAKGIDSLATGMAGQAILEGYDWDNDTTEMRVAARDGLLLSNHSYGFSHGFEYDEELSRWEWWGDVTISEKEDYKFGFYGEDTRVWDDIAHENPFYLIVKSAGNDRLQGPSRPGTEHLVYDNGWKLSTAERNVDGAPEGYDCINMVGTAKNILTVGAVEDLDSGYRNPEGVVMTYFSSFGPTDDGRIKPDIVGNGWKLYSTYSESDTSYNTLSGTSMAAPNVTGSLALLQELHYKLYSRYMRSATLKGLALHTADDAGNPGPDYRFGWGLLNTYHAARLIADPSLLLREDSISDQGRSNYTFYAPGDSMVRITLCWTDPKGPHLGESLDPEDLILVNDLDMRLVRRSDSAVFRPYILDPANPDSVAGTGDNFRDNIEQIYLPSAEKGYYDLEITHKDTLEGTVQHYSLIYEGADNVYVAADTTYLTENNGFLQVTDAPDYPLDRNFTWHIEPQNQQPVTFSFTSFSTSPSDTVTIFDGPGDQYPVLGRFSGDPDLSDTLLFSTAGTLFIVFSTGNERDYQGFSARYCTTPPQEQLMISGEPFPCAGNEETYFYEPAPESEYFWSFSSNVTGPVTEEKKSVRIPVPGEAFTLYLTPENNCGTGTASERTISPVTAPPGLDPVIIGDTLPCINSSTLFGVEQIPAASYWWTLPVGWEGRSDSSSIRVYPTKGTGIIAVTAVNSCGESDKAEQVVRGTSPPRAPVIQSDRINPCENEIQLFRVQAEEGISYRWEANPGWEIIGPDSLSEVSVMVGSGASGRMYVNSVNKCGDTLTSRNFLLSPAPISPDLWRQLSSFEGLEELTVHNYYQYQRISWYRNDSLYENYHENSLILHRNGTYSVEVTNSDGCTARSEASDNITVDEASLRYSISTATGGVIRVENDTSIPAQLRAYDLTGRIVFSGELQPGSNIYQTTRRGLLIFRIEGDGQGTTQMVFIH